MLKRLSPICARVSYHAAELLSSRIALLAPYPTPEDYRRVRSRGAVVAVVAVLAAEAKAAHEAGDRVLAQGAVYLIGAVLSESLCALADRTGASSGRVLFALLRSVLRGAPKVLGAVRGALSSQTRSEVRRRRREGAAALQELLERGLVLELGEESDCGAWPEEPEEDTTRIDRLHKAIALLKPSDRRLAQLLLRGFTSAEIAVKLGLKSTAARARVSQVRARLRSILT